MRLLIVVAAIVASGCAVTVDIGLMNKANKACEAKQAKLVSITVGNDLTPSVRCDNGDKIELN